MFNLAIQEITQFRKNETAQFKVIAESLSTYHLLIIFDIILLPDTVNTAQIKPLDMILPLRMAYGLFL